MECIMLIEEAVCAGARIEQACETIDLSPETLRRWKGKPDGIDERAGPHTPSPAALSDAEKAMIAEVVSSARFRDKSPWQIVPALADEGLYIASEASFYRVMREKGLIAHRGRSRPRQKRQVPCLIARRPNEIWSWDITYLLSPVAGQFFRLYLVMDVFSRKIVGWEVHERECGELASHLVERICREEGIPRGQLTLHADNGGPMKGATLLVTLERLGVAPSHSRPRVSDDNPFSESLFKTLKYVPEYPDGPFETIEQARAWVERFVAWYNTEHLHSEIRYVTPASRHDGADQEILDKRKDVYESARRGNPERWSGNVRDWSYIAEVSLNARKRRAKKTGNLSEHIELSEPEETMAA
jgi:transposase InsO family protein